MDLITYLVALFAIAALLLIGSALATIGRAIAAVATAIQTGNEIADQAHPHCGHGNRHDGCPYEHRA